MNEKTRCIRGLRATIKRVRAIGHTEIADTLESFVNDLCADIGVAPEPQESPATQELFPGTTPTPQLVL